MRNEVSCSRGEREIPEHPCLQWVATSQDDLYRDVSRRLITMRKVNEYKVELQEMYKKHTRDSIMMYNISYNDIQCLVCCINASG